MYVINALYPQIQVCETNKRLRNQPKEACIEARVGALSQ